MSNFKERLLENKSFARAYRQEGLIVDVTESIYDIMRKNNISKAELARKSGLDKSRITKLLDGSANMTLKSIADIAFALGVEPKVYMDKREAEYPTLSQIGNHWESNNVRGYNPKPKAKSQYTIKAVA